MTCKLVAAGLAAMLGLALAGCAQPPVAVETPVDPNAVRLSYCSEANPEGFDPSRYTSGTTYDASSRQLYDRLVTLGHEAKRPAPALAESWSFSPDGTEVIFNLRRGVEFHTTASFTPTRDFNADDVVFTFEKIRDPKHPYYRWSRETGYFEGMNLDELIEEVSKLDDYTVRFRLSHPDSSIVASLAIDFASILSAEYAKALLEAGTPEKLNREPVGTGPFQFVSYRKGETIRYKAHPDYWRGRAALDELLFVIEPDNGDRFDKLRSGECHVMAYPHLDDLEAMAQHPEIELLSAPALNVGYLAYNTREAPFNDPKVRRALNMAIDKRALVEAVFGRSGMVATNPIPPGMWSYNDAIRDDPYDPAAAKTLLAEAGVANLETRIWSMPVQRPYMPYGRRAAEMIRDDWAEIGVEASIVSDEWYDYLRRTREKNREGAVLLGWTSDNADPDNFLYALLSCEEVGAGNRAQWCYKPFEDLILQAKRTGDLAERTRLYEQAQVIFKEQAPWAPLGHSIIYVPVRKEVTGYVIDPYGGHYFYGVSLTSTTGG